jgi:hypothetical protein
VDEPEVGRKYHLVRRRGADIDHARFIRFEDGSAILDEGTYGYNIDNAAEAWRRPWAELKGRGYEEVGEAVEHGLISREEAQRLTKRRT